MNKDTKEAVSIIVMGSIVLAIIALIAILATGAMSHPSSPSAPIHYFDAQDYYNADRWCKAHGYTTIQDVVHGVSGTAPSTVVGASCLDPSDKTGAHIPAPYTAAVSSPASGALK